MALNHCEEENQATRKCVDKMNQTRSRNGMFHLTWLTLAVMQIFASFLGMVLLSRVGSMLELHISTSLLPANNSECHHA